MSNAKITLFGMYKYFESMGDDLFSGMYFPDGINKDTVVHTILMNGGEYEALYADPDFVKFSIVGWCDKWYDTFRRWIRVLKEEYNPIWNYDRTEEEIRTPDITHQRTANLKDKRTADIQTKRDADLTDTNGGQVTEETKRSAYDSNNYEPDERKVTTPENTIKTTGTDTVKETGTDTQDHTGTDTNRETGTEKWNRVVRGNIGVTTSQQMVMQELEVSGWPLYDNIARIFLSEYVIPIIA